MDYKTPILDLKLTLLFSSHAVLRKLYYRCVRMRPTKFVVLSEEEAMVVDLLLGDGLGRETRTLGLEPGHPRAQLTAESVIARMQRLLPEEGAFFIGRKPALAWTLDTLSLRAKPQDRIAVSLVLHAGARLRCLAVEANSSCSPSFQRLTRSLLDSGRLPPPDELNALRTSADIAIYDKYLSTSRLLAGVMDKLR